MDGLDFITADLLDNLSTMVILTVVALSVITDKLVWHTRLKNANARADRWEKIAIEALVAGAQAGVKAAETTVDVISSLPDPASGHRGD